MATRLQTDARLSSTPTRCAPYPAMRYPRAAHYKWCFTLFYYTQEEYDVITGFISSACLYGVVGQERSTNGHPHLQGYFWLHRARTFFYVKKMFFGRVHLEVAIESSLRNREYCIKEGNFWEHGRLDANGEPEQVELRLPVLISSPTGQQTGPQVTGAAQPNPGHGAADGTNDALCDQSIQTDPMTELPPFREECQTVWLWGPTGVGKSHYARDKYPNAYWKAPHIYWGSYERQTDAILDAVGLVQRPHREEIVRWIDKFPCMIQTKGGECPLYVTNFIITSAYPPEEVFADSVDPSAIMRRMKIFHITNRNQFRHVDEYYESLKRDSLHYYSVDINRCPNSPTTTD